jgi:hypothetical protein
MININDVGATLVVALSPHAVRKLGDHKGRPYSGQSFQIG